MAYNYEVKFNLDKCIKTLGLEEKGRVQQFVTNEVKRLSDSYVPFDIVGKYDNPGALRDSARIDNGTDIVWGGVQGVPYARRLYYHDEYRYQGAPIRGAYWVDRMLANGGMQKIEEGARRVVSN